MRCHLVCVAWDVQTILNENEQIMVESSEVCGKGGVWLGFFKNEKRETDGRKEKIKPKGKKEVLGRQDKVVVYSPCVKGF